MDEVQQHRVLVADNSQNIQKLVKVVLKDQPFEVISFDQNAEIVNQVIDRRVDVLLLDFALSDKQDGYALAYEIKTRFPHCQVMLLFGTFDQPDKEKLHASKVEDFLYKPFDGEKLIKACNRLAELSSDKSTKMENSYNKNMNTAALVGNKSSTTQSAIKLKAELEKEISHWQISVPEVLFESNDQNNILDGTDVPGVIGDDLAHDLGLQNSVTDSPVATMSSNPPLNNSPRDYYATEKLYPKDDDLEYPSIAEDEPEIIKAEQSHPSIEALKNLPTELEAQINLQQQDREADQMLAELSSVPSVAPKDEVVEKFDRTEVVDMHKISEAQADLLGKLKAQIKEEVEEDFWHADDHEVEVSTQSSIPSKKNNEKEKKKNSSKDLFRDSESVFSLAEKQALKNEILASIRHKMVAEIKFEIVAELRTQLISDLTPVDREKIISDMKKNFNKDSHQKILKELVSNLSTSLKAELVPMVKSQLQEHGLEMLQELALKYFESEAKQDLWDKVVHLAENQIKHELSQIRKVVEDQ